MEGEDSKTMDLHGKTALVTGGGKRVGRAIALHLASLGCRVAVHYRSSLSEAMEVVRDVESNGGVARFIQADLSVREEAERAAHEALEWNGHLDILVCSAANFGRVEMGKIERADWDFALDTNLLGPFWLAQAIGPSMVERGCGKIVNIADISWQSPWPSRLPYCVSKAGLVSLTIGLAKAFAPHVQVNAVGPGPVMFPEDYTEAQRKAVIAKTVLKREGSPLDVALAVEFFCRCDFVTGVFLPVDGGRSLPGTWNP